MTAIELMDLTFKHKLSELDQYKIVSDLTTQFDPQLLTLLLKSVDLYIERKRKFLIGYRVWSKKLAKYEVTKFDREWTTPLGTDQAIENIVLTPQELEELNRDIPITLIRELQPLQDLRVMIHKLTDNNNSKNSQGTEDAAKMVEVFLKPLSGYLEGRKIMKDEDYQYLLKSTAYLISNKELPSHNQTVIGRTPLTAEFIRYSFHCLFSYLYVGHNNALRKKWQLFLHSMFFQFANHGPNTTLKNFKTQPKNYEEVLRSIEYK